MFIVYSKPACPHCVSAKSLLQSKGLEFEEIHLDVGQQKVQSEMYISREDLLAKIPTARTMPQIQLKTGNEIQTIGGFSELKTYLT